MRTTTRTNICRFAIAPNEGATSPVQCTQLFYGKTITHRFNIFIVECDRFTIASIGNYY